ncbi:MAG: tetratricopeptide repeat protein [Chitinophagaceae bacterium]
MIRFYTTILICITISGNARAQSLDTAKQLIYHERFGSAVTVLHDFLKSDPGNGTAWYLLARAYIGAGTQAVFNDTLQLAPEGVKDQPLIKSVLGHILLIRGDSLAAKAEFNHALKNSKMKDPGVLAEIASAHIATKDGNAVYALELLQKAIKKDKHSPALYVLTGDAYRKLMDGGNAYKAYQEALAKDKTYAEADYKIGKIYTSQKNAGQYLPSFEKAVAADPQYAPALYELYYHYYFTNLNLAKGYLTKYIQTSDYNIKNDYLVTDMLYATGKFSEAIAMADALIKKEGKAVQPRLYKLEAYSYKEQGDSLAAVRFMNSYFALQPDSGIIAKDYEAMGNMYASLPGKEDSAAYFLAKGADLEQDTVIKSNYYKQIAALYKKQKDYANESVWLGKYYSSKPGASNVDLFNWGLSSYLAKDYPTADTVFAMYEIKYPAEEFGPYWRARTNAAIDTAMVMGIAVPHYMNLITLIEKDSLNSTAKKHLIEAYGYIAAYKANAEKDYETAVSYFEKLLTLDPENGDAKKYIDILKKNMVKNNDAGNSR